MSLTVLTMNYAHLMIPLLRNNMTLINLHHQFDDAPDSELDQILITSTADTTKRKT